MENNCINVCLKELNQSLPETQDTSTLKSNLAKAMTIEHCSTATMLKYLAEFEVRGLHLKEGFSSIFKFLTDGHGYSEAAAMRRLTVARFGRDCPEVFVMIERGDLNLSLASMAARVFESREIHASKKIEVLRALTRKSKTAAETIFAQFGAKTKAPAKKNLFASSTYRLRQFKFRIRTKGAKIQLLQKTFNPLRDPRHFLFLKVLWEQTVPVTLKNTALSKQRVMNQQAQWRRRRLCLRKNMTAHISYPSDSMPRPWRHFSALKIFWAPKTLAQPSKNLPHSILIAKTRW